MWTCAEGDLEQRSSGSWTNVFVSHPVAFWRCLAGMSPGCAAHRSRAKPSPDPSRSRKPGKIHQVGLSQCDHGSFTPLVNRFTGTGFSYRLYKTHLGPSHQRCHQSAAGEPWIWGSCMGLPPSPPTLPDSEPLFSPSGNTWRRN